MLKPRHLNDSMTRIARSLALVLIALFVGTPTAAFAIPANELFADGNRLFRDDLYWAALLRYEQAGNAGMDTPLLHYNTGVAHYKAGQHKRARESLLKASRSYNLEVLSHYNLGLNAWAAGDSDEALRWFGKARNQDRSQKIRSLAGKAIKRIEAAHHEEDEIIILAEARIAEKQITNFNFRARIGGGVDSNVFRSPSEPYIDQADPNLPLIVPEVQQGFFIPVSMSAIYAVNSFEHESFFGAYRFGGRFYQDEALKNGDEYLHELSFGTEYKRREENRTRRIYSAFRIAEHNEVYYDRDTGGERLVNDVDITDRFNYFRYGPEFSFRQSYDRLAIGTRLKAQLWNYENTEEVPEYDHEYFLVGLNAQYRFTRTSLLRVTADMYKRHFGERPSFELDGTQPVGNTPVKYDYIEYGINARQRLTRSLWFGLDFLRTTREDRHVGYNNYIRNSYGVELHWRMGDRFGLEASGSYLIYDYENAFAYQNPAAGRKTLERVLGTLIATFDMTPHLSLVTEYRYEDAKSNDARIAYNRSRIAVSIVWENR